MLTLAIHKPRLSRTLMVLGRISNLPTVWSNCLAGWWLGGHRGLAGLGWLLLGATLLYLGGMYWNDAFDTDFDRRHRPERPIPSGSISASTVWWLGGAMLGLGWVSLATLGWVATLLAFLLLACIVAYDAVHKWITFSPVLMASCRFFLILLAVSAGGPGVSGLGIWTAIVLAAYVAGLSYLARQENFAGPLNQWPVCLLAAPVLLAWLVDDGEYRARGIAFSLILLLWIVWSLRHTFWSAERRVGRTVAELLAGIVLVDLLSIAGGNALVASIFFALFFLALALQRFIPAT